MDIKLYTWSVGDMQGNGEFSSPQIHSPVWQAPETEVKYENLRNLYWNTRFGPAAQSLSKTVTTVS